MAKGIEDTAFYRAFPLASLNEVGGNPERFGIAIDAFHRHNAERLDNWPHTLLTTSSHDTKRSEDVRARINALSEMPRDWERAVQRWRAMNRNKKVELDGAEVPGPQEEYLLYQTLIGAWPLPPMDEAAHEPFVQRLERYIHTLVGAWPLPPMDEAAHEALVQRLEGYMEKALKEAKLHTSWINPNEAYDQAVRQFVREILAPHEDNRFLADLRRFQGRIAQAGMWNSLSQTLLKSTVPGVPDFYQGNELWDFSLVDPDNRRPVDFRTGATMLDELQRRESTDLTSLVRELVARRVDGRIKLYVTYKALNFRREHRDLFEQGAYQPLTVSGAKAEHLLAFARHLGSDWALVAVPRLTLKLSPSAKPPLGKRLWKDTVLHLPEGAPKGWQNMFTGEGLAVSNSNTTQPGLLAHEVFRRFPVALLMNSPV
jgi:(1->4)-alpha-D-glucan 1-alpha-D-glucosylmutase